MLPNSHVAIVDIQKLRDYCLNAEHPTGKHKARVFASALGLTADNADELRDAILEAARSLPATPTESDRFGQRYVLDFHWQGSSDGPVIRTAWIIRSDDGIPRLTTCFVL